MHPYCTRIKKGNLFTQCTEDRDAVALCNLVEYAAPLPEHFQVNCITGLFLCVSFLYVVSLYRKKEMNILLWRKFIQSTSRRFIQRV